MTEATHLVSISLDGLRPGNPEKILKVLIDEFKEANLSDVKKGYESLTLNIETNLAWNQTPEALESFIGGIISGVNPENIFIYMDIDLI